MTTGLARQSLHLTASSSSSKSRRYHRYPRQRGGGGRREEVVVVNTTTNSNKKISPTTKTTHVLALIIGSLGTSLLASQSSVLFSAFAEEASATASGSEISPFAGVVDIAALGLLGVFAYLGNKKSSENVQSERQKTITNMPSRRNRTPPPKPKWVVRGSNDNAITRVNLWWLRRRRYSLLLRAIITSWVSAINTSARITNSFFPLFLKLSLFFFRKKKQHRA